MDDSIPKIQIVKKSATQALSDLKNNPPGGPVPSSTTTYSKEVIKNKSEYLDEIPHSPEIPPELKEHGIEANGETIELPQELTQSGVERSDNLSVFEPPKTNLIGKVPLSTQQMQKGLHAKVADSILWLVYWCMRQIQMEKHKLS